jgi:hypothetical protein
MKIYHYFEEKEITDLYIENWKVHFPRYGTLFFSGSKNQTLSNSLALLHWPAQLSMTDIKPGTHQMPNTANNSSKFENIWQSTQKYRKFKDLILGIRM